MGDASLDLVDRSIGLPVLLECFFGLWRPSCPAGLKLVKPMGSVVKVNEFQQNNLKIKISPR